MRAAYLVDMAKAEALDTMGENRKAVEPRSWLELWEPIGARRES